MAGATGATHLHIGPGRLGLGLIVAAGTEAGLDVHLVARSASQVPALSTPYRALVRGEAGEFERTLAISTLSKAETLAALDPGLRELISGSPELLVTVAATTAGLHERREFLLELAEARAQSPSVSSTIFIPCENDVGSAYPELKGELEDRGVDCRAAMVNRLCPEAGVSPVDRAYEVMVDELAEWVIEGEAAKWQALAALSELSYVDFADDIAPFKLRKRWLVNGAHLALAIVAHAARLESIDVAAAEPGRSAWLGRLHATMIEALDQAHPGLEENEAYASDHVGAWLRHKDEVSRILRRLRRAEPLPFFDDLEAKFLEPLSLLGPVDRFPEALYVLDRLHRVLQRATSYVDYKMFGELLPKLSRSVDLEMLNRYQRLLEPLLGVDVASARGQSLAASLETHRERATSAPR